MPLPSSASGSAISPVTLTPLCGCVAGWVGFVAGAVVGCVAVVVGCVAVVGWGAVVGSSPWTRTAFAVNAAPATLLALL